MRPYTLLAWAAFAGLLTAQTPANPPSVAIEDPTVLRKKIDLEKVRLLVENGTLPRARLEKAQQDLLDAQDEAIITRALYGKDLSASQAQETVDAAQRRVDRRKKAAEEEKKLVEQGIISQSEMIAAVEDVERAQKELDWAVARARLVKQVEVMAAAEADLMRQLETASPMERSKLAEYFAGKGTFTASDLQRVEAAYAIRFAKPLPITANGETATHKSMGFDHRGRVDVGLRPDQPEGVWLRHFLTVNRIPFFAFRTAIAHKATGAHIHMGPPSTRYVAGGAASGL